MVSVENKRRKWGVELLEKNGSESEGETEANVTKEKGR